MKLKQTQKTTKQSFYKRYKFTKKQKNAWLIILGLLLVLTLISGVYGYAYNRGYDNGKKSAKNVKMPTVRDFLKPSQNPLNSVTGTVESFQNNELTVATNRGESQKIRLTTQTKISKKTDPLTSDALKKGVKVTVFVQGEDKDMTANRIVIRD